MHEKKVNNFTNINKVNNYFQPETIDHTKTHGISCWKSSIL